MQVIQYGWAICELIINSDVIDYKICAILNVIFFYALYFKYHLILYLSLSANQIKTDPRLDAFDFK